MSFAKVHSAQATSLIPQLIDVEVDIANGLYSFSIIGLGDKAIEESRERVSSALKNSGITPPKHKSEKVTVALAPAHVRKHGPLFDVAIAIGYLCASRTLQIDTGKMLFLGELSLDGQVRNVKGVLPLVKMAQVQGFTDMFVPFENAEEAAVIEGVRVFGIHTLRELVDHLHPDRKSFMLKPFPQTRLSVCADYEPLCDLQDIRGQHIAKRGAEIAATGGHNIALYGPPGTGKTLLARAMPHLLPPLSFEETLEVSSIHSIAGTLTQPLITTRPFRAPHHSSSFVAVIGGGGLITPGEITLAHKGILFLDEFPEFDRRTVESLRGPLEDGVITIARSSGTVTYPAQCMLVATLNPCPCGYHAHPQKPCTCTAKQIVQYHQKISGPIVDRIDMWLHMEDVPHETLLHDHRDGESTQVVARRVLKAREIADRRQRKPNAQLSAKETLQYVALDAPTKQFFHQALATLNVSARSVHKILRIARTIADLEDSASVTRAHLLEALQYRKIK
jgi:magnesium chelatase family protein